MKKVLLSVAAILALATVFAFTLIQGWQITEQYNITFAGGEVSGVFKKFTGTIVFDEQNLPQSRFDVAIDVASINTGNGLQNKHAKGADWFEADKYPSIKFTSSRIVKSGAGYSTTGTLEMHGVKKEYTLPFSFKKAGTGATFSGSFTVNRNDFHIGKPGGDVAEVIKLDVSIPVVKK